MKETLRGVPGDTHAKHRHEHGLALQALREWPVLLALLIAIPAFYLELAGASLSSWRLGRWLYGVVAALLLLHLAMAVRHGRDVLALPRRHGLDLAISIGALLSLFGSAGGWSATEWALRALLVGLIVARLLICLRPLLSARGTIYVFALGVATLLASGLGFYWLEPSVKSYADGLWLAFVSGATVGYGDIVPTTAASRIFAVFMVLLGYALMSLATASIAALFVGEDEKILRREMHRDIKALQEEVRLLREELHSQSRGSRGRAAARRRQHQD